MTEIERGEKNWILRKKGHKEEKRKRGGQRNRLNHLARPLIVGRTVTGTPGNLITLHPQDRARGGGGGVAGERSRARWTSSTNKGQVKRGKQELFSRRRDRRR